ncbi:MAG TPA: antibiotic biosynthesis monooxygenase [Ramlibacter sp.]|nr:antibiotic biosynthesis monooxygenase [Ramlibacter sp.]
MIAVIFEVWPHPEHRDAYLAWAADLKPQLQQMEGFISIERFQSLSDEGKLLSLSFWRDEECLAQWRQLEAHRAAQAAGRATIFRDYHLRIANVARDYGMQDRAQAPQDSRARHG